MKPMAFDAEGTLDERLSREPETEAGRALLARLPLFVGRPGDVHTMEFVAARVLAIESEARAAALPEVAEKVRALPEGGGWPYQHLARTGYEAARAAVLALIEGSDPASPEPLPDGACGVMGLCERRKGHEGKHSTSVDRALAATPVAGSTIPPLDRRVQAVLRAARAVMEHPESEPDTNEWWDKVNDLTDAARAVPTVTYARLAGSTEPVTEEPR